MSPSLVKESLILLLLVGSSLAVVKNQKIESLSDGSVVNVPLTHVNIRDAYIQPLSVASNSKITLQVTNVSSNTSFIIVQIHTYQYNVTLSYDEDHTPNVKRESVFGSNIGLYFSPGLQTVTQFHLKNDNVHLINAMFVAIPYNSSVPVPGGCNMEFDTSVAPYAKVYMQKSTVVVDIQPSSASLRDKAKSTCEKNQVQYEFYRLYITEQDYTPDSYFTGILSMLTVDDIIANGQKVVTPVITTPMRRVFSAYTGVGSVYVAVATYKNFSAAYVPGFSYACSPVLYLDSCEILNDIFSKLICAACFFLGLFSICYGYKYFIPFLFIGTVFGYIFVTAISNYEASVNFMIALGIGLGISALVVLLRWRFNNSSKIVTSLIFTLLLAVFVAFVIYYRSPDSFVMIQRNKILWTLFFITVGSIMMIYSSITIVITCALYSSYLVVLSIDYCLGSSLKYIVINVIRMFVVDDFKKAIIQPPIQAKEVCLIILGILLALVHCFKFQMTGICLTTPIRSLRDNLLRRSTTERSPLVA